MRNMYQLDNDGKPSSKGYGFVAFNLHTDALVALRKINNSPSIFHPNKVSSIIAFFSPEILNLLSNLEYSKFVVKKVYSYYKAFE